MSKASDTLVAVPGGSVFVRRWSAPRGDRPPVILLHDSLGSGGCGHVPHRERRDDVLRLAAALLERATQANP